MSRNLGTSDCPFCGYDFDLDDIMGLPLSKRGHAEDAPTLGVDLKCPGSECGREMFVWLHTYDWNLKGLDLSWGRSFNDEPKCYHCMDHPDCDYHRSRQPCQQRQRPSATCTAEVNTQNGRGVHDELKCNRNADHEGQHHDPDLNLHWSNGQRSLT
jgi:hypothetical protein